MQSTFAPTPTASRPSAAASPSDLRVDDGSEQASSSAEALQARQNGVGAILISHLRRKLAVQLDVVDGNTPGARWGSPIVDRDGELSREPHRHPIRQLASHAFPLGIALQAGRGGRVARGVAHAAMSVNSRCSTGREKPPMFCTSISMSMTRTTLAWSRPTVPPLLQLARFVAAGQR